MESSQKNGVSQKKQTILNMESGIRTKNAALGGYHEGTNMSKMTLVGLSSVKISKLACLQAFKRPRPIMLTKCSVHQRNSRPICWSIGDTQADSSDSGQTRSAHLPQLDAVPGLLLLGASKYELMSSQKHL